MLVLGVGGIVFFVREFHTFTGNPVAMAIIVSLLVIVLGMMALVGAFGVVIMPYKVIKGWTAITRRPSPSHQSLGS
jgi:hypothetical protein